MNLKSVYRKFVVVALSIVLTTLFADTASAQAASQKKEIVGCALNLGASSFDQLGVVQPGGTGNQSLDAGIQTDILELQKVFGVEAKLFLLKESTGPNAFAIGQAVPQVLNQFQIKPEQSRDGMVFFGMNLMQAEYKSEFGTGYAVPSIIAHEYAHIMQFKSRFSLGIKWQELHADYLAGWFTGHRRRHYPQNIDESIKSFFSKGDYDFNNSQHHGTPQERMSAFVAGLNLNLRSNVSSGTEAYNQGLKYLQQLGAK